MKLPRLARFLPSWKNAALAILSAILLILAFPDFEFWFLAWFALVPLLGAIVREKESATGSFVLGWIWGLVFFTGTCWWLTFAPITYAAFPWALAYFLLLIMTAIVAIFSGVFAMFQAILIRRFGSVAMLAAPFVWVSTEFLRYWITGNNWNAIGYSQAFGVLFLRAASFAGVLAISFVCVLIAACYAFAILERSKVSAWLAIVPLALIGVDQGVNLFLSTPYLSGGDRAATVVAIQPNVPMSGLTYEKWQQLRRKHIELAEAALATINDQPSTKTTVVFPESPMNFMYDEDEEFRNFVHAFARRHDVQRSRTGQTTSISTLPCWSDPTERRSLSMIRFTSCRSANLSLPRCNRSSPHS
jgi:apolipoprotein N-acyltransferase